MENVKLINHPIVEHKLTSLRDKNTPSSAFKKYLHELSMFMGAEVLKDVKLKEIEVETPIKKTKAKVIDQKITIYPILRAGLGMSEAFTELLPKIKVGHIGMYRDPKTLKPVEYLFKYPSGAKNGKNIIIDPMLATGGSAIMAIDKLKETGMKNISFVALVSSKKAIEMLSKKYSDVKFYIAAIDPILNKKGYIEPGLGDAGDRIFGTK